MTLQPSDSKADAPLRVSAVPLWVGLLPFLFALLFYLWAVSVGWHHTADDGHSFRQAQTSMTAQYMVGKPFKLAYETPMFGPPWSVPMEFPLYQWLVARLSPFLGIGLVPTGRAVSILFHLLSVWMGWFILSSLRVGSGSRLLVLALWLLSPFYIFWSRTFMIESTALFLSLSYLAGILRNCRGPHLTWLVIATASGCLAAMVKITTFASFGVAGCVLLAFHTWQSWRGGKSWIGSAGAFCALTILPFISLLWWTSYADAIKSQSIIGRKLMSRALTTWNFGSVAQKLDLGTWESIFSRTGTIFADWRWLFWALALGGIGAACMIGRRRREMLSCLLLFVLSPAIFTNLYYEHDYYQYANGVFIVCAVGLAIVEFVERRHFRWLAVACCVVLGGLSVKGYIKLFYPQQRIEHLASWNLGQTVRNLSATSDVNIFFAPTSDPSIAYHSGRRALIISNSHDENKVLELLRGARGCKIGGIFVEDGSHYSVEKVKSMIDDAGLGELPVRALR